MMRTTLVIGGLDPTGGAGITADARTLAVIGVHSMTVATAVVPQNLQTVKCVTPLPVDAIQAEIESAFETATVHSCKVSVIYSRNALHNIVGLLTHARAKEHFPIVFDPVMHATVGEDLSGDSLGSFTDVLSICDVITPNVEEAMTLAKIAGAKSVQIDAIGVELTDLMDEDGLRTVVVTDGSRGTDRIYQRTAGSMRCTVIGGERIPGKVHGSGCMHSSVIAGLLAKGYQINDACALAKSFVEDVLRRTLAEQKDKRSKNLLPMIARRESKYECAEAVYEAAMRICAIIPRDHLPEVGTNIAFSLPAPQGLEEVCALTSRIVKWEDTVRTFGRPRFGVESHMARMAYALARKRYDIRSCCNMKYSPELVKAIKRTKLKCLEIKRANEPSGRTTMDWIVENLTDKDTGENVSVIYDTGMSGKEAMIRVLGRDPGDVVRKVLKMFRKV